MLLVIRKMGIDRGSRYNYVECRQQMMLDVESVECCIAPLFFWPIKSIHFLKKP
jgi:hypothetical protein